VDRGEPVHNGRKICELADGASLSRPYAAVMAPVGGDRGRFEDGTPSLRRQPSKRSGQHNEVTLDSDAEEDQSC